MKYVYLLCLYRIDEKEPKEGYKVAPKADSMQCHHCTEPGTKEVPGEEVVSWNSSAVGDLPLSEDHGSLHPQGSLYVANKIHVLYVEDVKDTLY